jgi:peptide/nickel transport system permease protein
MRVDRPAPAERTALLVLVAFAALAALAPVVAPYSPTTQLDIITLQNRPPSWSHLLGTDVYARDVFSRILYGARVSLGIGILAAAVSVGIGTLVGAAAGYFGRRIDTALMRLVDIGLAVPRIFLVLLIIAAGYRLGAVPLAMLLGLTGWFGTSRLVRADILGLREQGFVEAARSLGGGSWRIMLRHLVPNVGGTITASAALAVANMMLLEAGLSFIGTGVQPPTPSWGNMIAEGRDYLLAAPWISVAPGLAIALTVMALHVVADRASRSFGGSAQ